MASDDQRLKRLEDMARAKGKLKKEQAGLLVKEDLTDRDRLHLLRYLAPRSLPHIRDAIEKTQSREAATLEDSMTKQADIDKLKQDETDILELITALDIELGDERVLITRGVYSEPRKDILR